MTKPQLLRLLGVGRALVTDLDLESVLHSVLEAARDLTNARYAALGILDSGKESLDRFLYAGLDDETRRKIGPPPLGRGVLGELIRNPAPLRLADVGEHPRSYGFPANHPPMTSFIGVPVLIRGEAFGNLYLTDKLDQKEFSALDEHLLTVLAEWAAVSIQNARLYEEAERRRAEAERAVQGLEATVSLSRLGSPVAGMDWLLETIAKRGRALVGSGWFVLLRADDAGRLEATNVAGDAPDEVLGTIVPNGVTGLNELLGGAAARRLSRAERIPPGVLIGDRPALLAALDNRGRIEGFAIAVEPLGRSEFAPDDELLLSSFASSAAGAIGTVSETERDRLRLSVRASEEERIRWARELHDETLQQLGAMKLMHESALERDDPDVYRRTVERGAAEFDHAIESLEHLITELRPAALDELGTQAALEALVDKVDSKSDLAFSLDVDLAFKGKGEEDRHTPELETTVYRIVQEGLNNALKHADAERVSVSVIESNGSVEVAVVDDGRGISSGGGQRFGLRGIRERVELAGGELQIKSAPQRGTALRATLPVVRREAPA